MRKCVRANGVKDQCARHPSVELPRPTPRPSALRHGHAPSSMARLRARPSMLARAPASSRSSDCAARALRRSTPSVRQVAGSAALDAAPPALARRTISSTRSPSAPKRDAPSRHATARCELRRDKLVHRLDTAIALHRPVLSATRPATWSRSVHLRASASASRPAAAGRVRGVCAKCGDLTQLAGFRAPRGVIELAVLMQAGSICTPEEGRPECAVVRCR